MCVGTESIVYSPLMIRIQRSPARIAEHSQHQSWLLAGDFRQPTSSNETRLLQKPV
jgi:hypothetical protein